MNIPIEKGKVDGEKVYLFWKYLSATRVFFSNTLGTSVMDHSW